LCAFSCNFCDLVLRSDRLGRTLHRDAEMPLSRCLRTVERFLHPEFSDPALRHRSDLEFRHHVNRALPIFTLACFAIGLIFTLSPRDAMPLFVWQVNRVTGALIFLYMVVALFVLRRCAGAWDWYNVIVFGAICVVLVPGTVTTYDLLWLSNATDAPGHDNETSQMMYSTGAWCMSLMAFRPDLRQAVLIWHAHLAIWLAKAYFIGIIMPWMWFAKCMGSYYIVVLFLFEQSRQHRQQGHRLLQMQVEVEALAEREKASARLERDEAVLKASLAEQRAMQALMGAIFDICGALQWQVEENDVAEPWLCFSAEGNPLLDDLLQQKVAGQPLDLLLGSPPPSAGSERDRWLQARKRLWDYASLEQSAERGEAIGIARKIWLTGANSLGQPLELELFLTPCCDGRVLFGILSAVPERLNDSLATTRQPDTQVGQTLWQAGYLDCGDHPLSVASPAFSKGCRPGSRRRGTPGHAQSPSRLDSTSEQLLQTAASIARLGTQDTGDAAAGGSQSSDSSSEQGRTEANSGPMHMAPIMASEGSVGSRRSDVRAVLRSKMHQQAGDAPAGEGLQRGVFAKEVISL